MQRFLRALTVVTALAAVAAGVMWTSRSSVSDRIAAEVRKSGAFSLAEVTPFKWDQALIFSPYSRRDQVCAALGATWGRCTAELPPTISEGDYLMAFVFQGNVVHHELHSRRHGDFCRMSCQLQFSPSEARFTFVAAANRYVAASGMR
jgi:hypothetical protein